MGMELTQTLTPSSCNEALLSTSLLSLLSLSSVQKVKAVIPSNISIASTWAWYMALTPYETVFLHLVMLQILLLRYLEILPINLNQLFMGEPTGRKKRSSSVLMQQFCHRRDSGAEALFKLLRKLDEHDCGLLTLCELEAGNTLRFSKICEEAQLILSALRVSRKRRLKLDIHAKCTGGPQEIDREPWAIIPFEEAVYLGSQVKSLNSTLCEFKFKACPLTKEDILSYVNQIFGTLS